MYYSKAPGTLDY